MKIGGQWSDETMETWLPIAGYPDYEVSDQGRVRSLDRYVKFANGSGRTALGLILKPWKHMGDYQAVGLRPTKKRFLIHALVLEAFVGPRPEGMVCCHIDGNPANNHVSNLRWGSYSENNHDLVRHGTHFQARKTHCLQGHEYTDENTRTYTNRGWEERVCTTCERDYSKAYKARKRAESCA